jgi:hypothetical protein
MSSITAKLHASTSPAQLASAITTLFLVEGRNAVDSNQLAFNAVIGQMLLTHNFSEIFEQLILSKDFDINKILYALDPNAYISTFDIYTIDTQGIGEYTDNNLVNNMMFTLVPKSSLLTQLLNMAADIDQDNNYAKQA